MIILEAEVKVQLKVKCPLYTKRVNRERGIWATSVFNLGTMWRRAVKALVNTMKVCLFYTLLEVKRVTKDELHRNWCLFRQRSSPLLEHALRQAPKSLPYAGVSSLQVQIPEDQLQTRLRSQPIHTDLEFPDISTYFLSGGLMERNQLGRPRHK